jgi:TolA-binding protein
MIKSLTLCLAACGALALAPPPARAQNRAETQMLVELRTLQEQVQRMQLAMNQLAEQVKATESRLDAQSGDTRKGFADQRVLIDAMATGLRAQNERENESAVRIAQLNQELKAIRDGLRMQQTLLNEIVGFLQPLAGAAAAAAGGGVTDPAAAATGAPPPPTGGTAAPKPGTIPPSPAEYYNTAYNYYYENQFEMAVKVLGDAISRFPESTEAPRAQNTIGDAYYRMGRFKEALMAHTAVITNYKDPDAVSDAYYKQGMDYEALKQIEAARKSYTQVVSLYPTSSAAVQAQQALRRIGK